MSERFSPPIILVGPTTVGKSEVAKHLADIVDGVIVNADKYYLYAGEHFMTGLGLSHDEFTDGRHRALFGVHAPEDPRPSCDQFLAMVDETAAGVRKRAIIEGCSYSFNMALIERYGVENAVCLTWADKSKLHETVTRRFNRLVAQGFYEETELALSNGYEHTYPMTSMLYFSGKKVVRGQITAEQAEAYVVNDGLAKAFERDADYTLVPGLTRMTHDYRHPEHTASLIASRSSANILLDSGIV